MTWIQHAPFGIITLERPEDIVNQSIDRLVPRSYQINLRGRQCLTPLFRLVQISVALET